jgi:hypothetical protein
MRSAPTATTCSTASKTPRPRIIKPPFSSLAPSRKDQPKIRNLSIRVSSTAPCLSEDTIPPFSTSSPEKVTPTTGAPWASGEGRELLHPGTTINGVEIGVRYVLLISFIPAAHRLWPGRSVSPCGYVPSPGLMPTPRRRAIIGRNVDYMDKLRCVSQRFTRDGEVGRSMPRPLDSDLWLVLVHSIQSRGIMESAVSRSTYRAAV